MNTLLSIRVQKLFAAAVFLKVVSAFLGWYLQLQWSLGLFLPLLVMSAYIALGLKRQDRDVSDEKFADSCYYLGFIFTITSIVFSLFDLPHIGERIQDIAVRFGAAMVSTVLGLAVRVYLVSFRPEASDALRDSEDAVLEAAQKFREQLVMAYEKLGDFQSQVIAATQASVEGVKLQVEKLSQDHSARMERVFIELNERNQAAVTQALSEVSAASSRMARSVDGYSESMKGSLQSLGDKVDYFGDALTQRLQTTTFPDDYFASQLAEPLAQLKAASVEVTQQVQVAASGTGEAASVLTAAIRKLKTKATQVEESLESVVRLTTAQHSVLDTSTAQLERLQQLGVVLTELQLALQASTIATGANAVNTEEVHLRITSAVSAVEASQRALLETVQQVLSRLDQGRDTSVSLLRLVESADGAAKELSQDLRRHLDSTQQLAVKLETEARAQPKLTAILAAIEAQTESVSTSLSSIDTKTTQVSKAVGAIASQLFSETDGLDYQESSSVLARRLPLSPTDAPRNGSVVDIEQAVSFISEPQSPSSANTRSNEFEALAFNSALQTAGGPVNETRSVSDGGVARG